MPGQKADPEWGMDIYEQRERRTGLVDILGELWIFDTLSWRELRKIERIVHRRYFATGEVVIQAWIPRSGLFVVLSGRVNVVRQREDGSLQVVGDLGPGELLGEFAILDDSPRSTSIVAAEPSELIGFFRPDLMDLIQTDPRMGFKVLYRLSQIMSVRLQEVLAGLKKIQNALETAMVGR